MTTIRAAFYARVSSEQQATTHTIESQTAALRERAHSDGTPVPPERQFADDGYSGATLIRPALDRLRDLATVARLTALRPLSRPPGPQLRLSGPSPRRVASAGIELVFLNRPLGQSPEDDLLLQVQGIVAEYERAKIMERSRRGKKHAAQGGSLNVMSGAPFGYRYVSFGEGGGQARFDQWLNKHELFNRFFPGSDATAAALAEVCRRLQKAGDTPRPGSESGPARPCGTFSRTPRIKVEPPMERHT